MIQQHKKGHHVNKLYQTGKYQLNKIETDDPLSPAPLNENADKLEAAITAEAAALEQRIVTLEAHRIYVGSYTGTSTYDNMTQTIHLGFTPIAVLVQYQEPGTYTGKTKPIHLLTAENRPLGGMMGDEPMMQIVDGGFAASTDAVDEWNDEGRIYHFIAFC